MATSENKFVIGAEIGSRGLSAATVDERGHIHHFVQGIHLADNAAATVNDFGLLVEQLLARTECSRDDVAGLGIAFGGPVDTYRGTIIESRRTPGFDNYPIVGMLEDRFGFPVVIENDARAAAFGEYCYGAGKGGYIMVYLQLGIGVGGGIVINDHLMHGKDMTSGELGHMQVTTDGPRCSCGKPGHLEAYVSESAIVKTMRELVSLSDSTNHELWQGGSSVTLQKIFEMQDVDEQARTVASNAIQMTGFAVANLVTALDCDTVVLGGYAVNLGSSYIAAIRSKVRQYAFGAAARNVHIAASSLGSDAALIGSAVLARQKAN